MFQLNQLLLYDFRRMNEVFYLALNKQSFFHSWHRILFYKKVHGYTKTLITLGNRLKDFEDYREIPISFDFITSSTQLFHDDRFVSDDIKLFLYLHKTIKI